MEGISEACEPLCQEKVTSTHDWKRTVWSKKISFLNLVDDDDSFPWSFKLVTTIDTNRICSWFKIKKFSTSVLSQNKRSKTPRSFNREQRDDLGLDGDGSDSFVPKWLRKPSRQLRLLTHYVSCMYSCQSSTIRSWPCFRRQTEARTK